MNSLRIEKDFGFQTALHFAGEFWINSYVITLSMIVETESEHEQNIAVERIAYYINNVLQNSILVESNDVKAIEKYTNAGLRVCELPAEPYDQLFASVLMLKLNSIMEERLRITDMVLSSSMSDGVRYSIVFEVAENSYSRNHWWNKSCTSIKDEDIGDNIVRLFDNNEWVDLGLSWKESI